jgi:Ferric reductase like transmembrane component
MLHRWIGYIAAIQVVLHSLLFLILGIQERVIGAWQRDHAWIAGSIATVTVVLIPVLALGLVRKTRYELFLILHIATTITLLVGAFYHLFYLYNSQNGGYIYYLWISIAFWVFDRLARVVRIAANGIKTAQVTIIDKDYIRVDIANVKAHGHAYLYFPTLTPWMFWENHVSRCQGVCHI